MQQQPTNRVRLFHDDVRFILRVERRATTVVIKAVPAGVCANCGQEYVDETTAAAVMLLAEAAALTGAPVEVRQFAAA